MHNNSNLQTNNDYINTLKFTDVNRIHGCEWHTVTVLQYWHMAVTAVATVCIRKVTQYLGRDLYASEDQKRSISIYYSSIC
jgi:hypothetical protein